MIHCLEHNAIDRAKWDALISDCGMVYALSWYLDIVHPHWEALVEDDYEAVMPLTGRQKFGIRYLCQPFFVQQLGVFSRLPLPPSKTEDFLQAVPRAYRFAEIRLNERNALDEGFQGVEYHRNVLLCLDAGYASLKACYHANTKRNLAKAESQGLRLTKAVTLRQVVSLFRSNRGATVSAWGDEEYATLLELGAEAMERGSAFLVGVELAETKELLCGALFMESGNRIVFLFSGCSVHGRQRQAMTFMIDKVIQSFSGQQVMLDFEGSDDDNLARFYLGFGGMEVKYPSYSFNRLPPFGKTMLRLWKHKK